MWLRRVLLGAVCLALLTALTACGSAQKAPAARTGAVAGATTLGSPLLAALAGNRGQTSRSSLDGMSTSALEAAVGGAFAVGVDLSKMNASTAGDDNVITAALKMGTPLVFENSAALTSYLGVGRGVPNRQAAADSIAAAAAMAAAVGVAAENHIAVYVPGLVDGATDQLICLSTGAQPAPLPTFTKENGLPIPTVGGRQVGGGDQTVPPGFDKIVLPGTVDPPVYSIASLLTTVVNAVNNGLATRAQLRTRQAKPALIASSDTLLTWAPHVWYPNGKSQDFVMESATHVQCYRGAGGSKAYLRIIHCDRAGDQGFYNRGSLVWKEDSDKGYFGAWYRVLYETVNTVEETVKIPEMTEGARSPQVIQASPAGSAESSTTINVEYRDAQNVMRNWPTTETRSFDISGFKCELWGTTGDGDVMQYRWKLIYVDDDDNDSNAPGYYNMQHNWNEMFLDKLGTDHVRWARGIARGWNGAKLLPKVQGWWSVPTTYRGTVRFHRHDEQDAWNPYAHSHGSYKDHHLGKFGDRSDIVFQVNFGTLAAAKVNWN